MKKSIFLILIIMLAILAVFTIKYKYLQVDKNNIANFNSEFEEYKDCELNGLDITTLINKATSNNEKYEIQKDENGLYILDNKYSIEIYLTMISTGNTYRMENINKIGINDFIRYFGDVRFKCSDIKYHKENGRISSMTFESKEY